MNSATLLSSSWAAFRRKLWFTALALLVLIFAQPVRLALSLQTCRVLKYADPATFDARVQEALTAVFSCHDWATNIILGILAVGAGLTFFRYMHDRRQVDLFHSLPHRREQLLVENLLAAWGAVLLPYLLAQLFSLIVTLALGFSSAILFSQVLVGFLIQATFLLAILVTMALAAVLSGHPLVNAIIAGLLFGYAPLAMGAYQWLRAMFQPTWYTALINWEALLAYSSPALRWASLCASSNGTLYMMRGVDWLYIGLYTVLGLGLALWLYRRRPSETAGRALAFPISHFIFKYPLALMSGALLGLLLHAIGGMGVGDGYLWFYIGAVLGVVLSCQIAEVVVAFDFHCALKRLPAMLVTTMLFLAASLALINDLPGYNSYLPPTERVVKAEVVLADVDFAWSERNIYYTFGSSMNSSTTQQQAEERLNRGTIIEPDALTALVQLTEKMVTTNGYGSTAAPERDYNSNHNYFSFTVRWTLDDGKVKTRTYASALDICLAEQELNAIYEDEGFRIERLTLFDIPAEQVRLNDAFIYNNFSTSYGFNGYYIERGRYINEDATALLAAYQQELSAMTAEQMREQRVLGNIYFAAFAANPGQLSPRSDGYYDVRQPYAAFCYPLYENFSNTIACLEKMGVNCADDLSNINLINLYSNGKDNYKLSATELPAATAEEINGQQVLVEETNVKITDPAEIARIIGETLPSEVSEVNRLVELVFYDAKSEIYNSISVEYHDAMGNTYTQFRYPVKE